MNKQINNTNQFLQTFYNQKQFAKLINVANSNIQNELYDEATYNLIGMAFYHLKQYENSISSFKQSIKLNPNFAEAYNNLGYPYRMIGNLDLAMKNYSKSIELKDDYAEALINLGVCYSQKKEFHLALKSFERALKFVPNSYDIYLNIGSIHIEKEDYQKALEIFKNLLTHNKNDFRVLNNLGNIYKENGDIDKSLFYFKKALEKNANDLPSLWNFSYCSLYKFDFINGWENYNLRWKMNNKSSPEEQLKKPIWDGFSEGKILVYPEQGIGDQILFLRCLDYFENKKNEVFVLTEKKLLKLIKYSFPKINVLESIKNIEFDYFIALGDIPKLFIRDVKSLKKLSMPYLFPNKDIKNKINFDIPKTKLICGISWKSSASLVGKNKSVTLELLKEIILLPNIIFIDLQYGETSEEKQIFLKKHKVKIFKNENIDNLNDINALSLQIKLCDFVVTISNTTAHLSGAIGKKTYLMLPKGNGKYWYWSQKDNKCLWYPSVEVIEQKKKGEWSHVIKKIKTSIKSRFSKII